MKIDSHTKNIIKKPWGYEYLVFQSEEVALWFLYISKGHKTSFHSHPNKTTGLIVLNGNVEVSFFNDKIHLSKFDKTMIRKGLFHSTESLNDDGSFLFEIETPNNKIDLVRFKDEYGREGKPYEDSAYEYPKEKDSLFIEKLSNFKKPFLFHNCNIFITKVDFVDFFDLYPKETNVMFLSGGLMADYEILVISPGDIVSVEVIKKLISVFDKIKNNTYVVIFQK
jgi:mannose-6-phosphate isomerase-like protein (cupin superfamily)